MTLPAPAHADRQRRFRLQGIARGAEYGPLRQPRGRWYRPNPVALVSFDIDGTMEFGDPPGPVSLEMVRESKRRGHVVGSASDRTLLEQRRLWEKAGIEVDFVSHKHFLEDTKASFPSDRLIHIGDTDVDEYYALLAGFEFFHVSSLPAPASLNWVY